MFRGHKVTLSKWHFSVCVCLNHIAKFNFHCFTPSESVQFVSEHMVSLSV